MNHAYTLERQSGACHPLDSSPDLGYLSVSSWIYEIAEAILSFFLLLLTLDVPLWCLLPLKLCDLPSHFEGFCLRQCTLHLLLVSGMHQYQYLLLQELGLWRFYSLGFSAIQLGFSTFFLACLYLHSIVFLVLPLVFPISDYK